MAPFELRLGEHQPPGATPLQQGGKTPVGYDRGRALDYAAFFCNRVCSDGVIMSDVRANRRPAGALLSEVERVSSENDCTHFISCCLGRPPAFKKPGGGTVNGGGLYISEAGFLNGGKDGVYGILNPGPLVHYLVLTRKAAYARVDAAGALSFDAKTPHFFTNDTQTINQLRGLIQNRFPTDQGKGDFVAYFSARDRDAAHAAILVSDTWGIACHTGSRCGTQPINDVHYGHFVYVRIKDFKEDPP
ncbi:MAG: hypothetical protein KDE22_09785 [Rhodobacterales bacterium]|nr:hypothetical protein [Rhodobacterales bacterium]